MAKKNKKVWQKIAPYLLNKYSISFLAIIIWILFFDKDDLFSQYSLRQKLHQLRFEEKYYKEEIIKCKEDIDELKNNPKKLEKFAREKYLMKKDNEEIYIIVRDSTKK